MPIFPLPPSGPRRLNFTIREITSSWDRRRFVRFAARVYRGDRYWPSGRLSESMRALEPGRNPVLAHLRLGLFMAESRTLDESIGTIAVWFDTRGSPAGSARQTGCFGLFEAINEGEVVSALLETAETWIQENLRGAGGLRGPAELDRCRSPGLLVDAYNARPAPLMPYNPPYYAELIENAGYKPGRDLLAYRLDLSALRDAVGMKDIPPLALAQGEEDRRGPVVLELARGPDRWAILSRAEHGPPDATWRLGPGSPPATFTEVLSRLKRIAGLHASAIILTAHAGEDGKPLAFGAAVPNRTEPALVSFGRRLADRWHTGSRKNAPPALVFRRATRAGIRLLPPMVRPDCTEAGIERLLLAGLLTRAARRGYATAEISPVASDDTAAAGTLAGYGAVPYKTYRIYEKGF